MSEWAHPRRFLTRFAPPAIVAPVAVSLAKAGRAEIIRFELLRPPFYEQGDPVHGIYVGQLLSSLCTVTYVSGMGKTVLVAVCDGARVLDVGDFYGHCYVYGHCYSILKYFIRRVRDPDFVVVVSMDNGQTIDFERPCEAALAVYPCGSSLWRVCFSAMALW